VPDDPTIEDRQTWKARKKRGAGTGKPPPEIVFNGSNILGDDAPPKIGAPTTYTEEMANRICVWLAAGKSLRSFCLQEGTPWATTVGDWRRANPAFDAKYARARDEGIDRIAELAHDEAAAAVDLPPEKVAGAKLRFDGHRWYAAKLAPGRYGDKIQAEVSGPGGGPLQLDVLLHAQLSKPEILARLSETQLEALLSAIPLLTVPAAGSEPVDAEFTEIKEKDK
jgi:hypothetical protein